MFIFQPQIYFTHSTLILHTICVFIFWMFMYILKEPRIQTSFFFVKDLSLCILCQQLALTYKGLSESYQRPQ